MKNIFKFSALLACLAMVGLVSCTEEELSTDQYNDGIVAFGAFGPNPVVRGDTLTILGSNLEKVREVLLPGAEPVTEFAEVVAGVKGHLKVVVPVAGPEEAPVTGLVTIVDQNGTKFSSLSELSYTEGIVISSFSPAEALPGDVVTIKGDYLYNTKEVVFVSGNKDGKTYVTGEAISATRYELKVTVPADAITGLIMLGDVDENNNPDNLIPNTAYTASDITIKDPSVIAFAKKTFKADDDIEITGEHLEMIKTVKFTGADVDAADFMVSPDAKKITVTLPATANDGAVTAVSYAGKEFAAGEIETVRPSEVAVAAETRYKAGLNVIVTGKDLDLVTGVKIAGVDASFSTTAAKATVVLPAESADGDVVLSLANGNTVTAGAIEVVKPVVESLSEASVVAGGEIVVKGKDLDLVTAVAISEQACEFSLEGEDLKVKVSKLAYTGDLVAAAANGCSSSAAIEVTYNESVSIEYVNASVKLGGEVKITGKSLMQIESISIKGNKVDNYTKRTDTELSFVLPDGITSPGVYKLDLVLISGEELTWAVPIEVTAPYTESFIWEGSENLGSWSNQPYFGAETAFADLGIAAGNRINIYFTVNDPSANWQYQIFDGHWNPLALPEIGGGQTVSKDNWDASIGYFSFEVTENLVSLLTTVAGWGGALLCQGENVTITGVSLIQYGSTETTVLEGEWVSKNYENLEIGNEMAWIEAGLQEGNSVRIYVTVDDPSDWAVQIFDGHWNNWYSSDAAGNQTGSQGHAFNQGNWDISKGYVEFEVNAERFAAMTTPQNWGFTIILQGKGCTFTKIAFI